MQSLPQRSDLLAYARSQCVLVFGASGHGKVVLDVLRLVGGILIAGFLDDFKPVGERCLGHEVLGGLRDLPAIAMRLGDPLVVMGIGDNWQRSQVVEGVRNVSPSTRFLSAIHPSAQIGSEVLIGEGTVMMAGAVVNTGARVGPFCILNTGSSLDHDSTMGAYASLAPGVVTGGDVTIGSFTNIGIGATVLPSVSVGKHAVIGAGSIVMRSVPDEVIAFGVPAKVIRTRQAGERYLRSAELGAAS